MKTVLNTGKQLGGLAKHVAKQVVKQPFEVFKKAAGNGSSDNTQVENQAMEALEQAQTTSSRSVGQSDDSFTGFATKGDFDRYSELSGERDEIEVNMLRKKLHQEYGVERGMEKARAERQQKGTQEEQVEEQEAEQEKFFEEEKKKEIDQVSLAKAATGAETRIGKKIVG